MKTSIPPKRAAATVLASALAFLATGSVTVAQATPIGPSAYLSSADSPFSPFAGFSYFHLENFEDHLLNTPGVTASTGGVTSVVFGPTIHDSVDADDGSIDGSGLGGDSFFSGAGGIGISFTFNAGALGGLPDAAGIVWTDGGGTITFEAFNALNESLGILTGTHADIRNDGGTAEDRFYGVTNTGGISRIHISSSSGGIEVDHLQYGLRGSVVSVPEPTSLALLGIAGIAGLGAARRHKR